MDSFMSMFGFCGSIFSTLATGYFWMVRMRQERPCLKPYFADKEFFLGVSRDGVRQVGVKLGVIVANYSVLPNAILGARLWLRTHDGWQELGNVAFDKQTAQPFNLPPLTTVLLRLTGTLSFPYQDALEQGNQTLGNYARHFLSQPREFKIELRRLHDRADTHVLLAPTEGDSSGQLMRAA
jgi:hypothetical protein